MVRSSTADPLDLNDDLAEKQRRRISNQDARRQSLAVVAREITRNDSRRSSRVQGASSRRVSGRLVPVEDDFLKYLQMIRSNRLNAENSWNMPLIDYFHDMSIFKTGNHVNFQRASSTLDGCVKVFGSRVDSVISDTNKLITGLVDSRRNGADSETAEVVEDVGESPKKKNRRKQAKSNLVAPEKLEIDLEELSNTIDPLFRKMCSDFDENGSRGMILNQIVPDETGRLVFDGGSSDDTIETERVQVSADSEPVDLAAYAQFLQGDLSRLSVLPHAMSIMETNISDEHIDNLIHDVQAWSLAETPLLNSLGEAQFRTDLGPELPMNEVDNFDDYAAENDVNEEVDANGAELDHARANFDEGTHARQVLDYFDNRTTAWWGRNEHWKVRRLKQRLAEAAGGTPSDLQSTKTLRHRRPLELIDFTSPLDIEELLMPPTKKSDAIRKSMPWLDFLDSDDLLNSSTAALATALLAPDTARRASELHLLPPDMHITSKRLMRLFLRPEGGPAKAYRRAKTSHQHAITLDADHEMEAEFWNQLEPEVRTGSENLGCYDPEFYAMSSGSTATRSDTIDYARAAKKTNIRQLKLNMWKSIERQASTGRNFPDAANGDSHVNVDVELTMSQVASDTAEVYRGTARSELSTPLFLMSLLHLANEKGLELDNVAGFNDLRIVVPTRN